MGPFLVSAVGHLYYKLCGELDATHSRNSSTKPILHPYTVFF